jgi:BirA family biotin operon repressor/biotin-[acetyl-CoA-carboxylase] ligase
VSGASAPLRELGRPRLHLRNTDSTNSRAHALAIAGAPHGTLVTAGEQSAGRGRQGRSWSAPAGRALLCSVVVRDPPRLLPLAAGVAVAEVSGPAAQLKWPNDVLIAGRKVAGILVEGRPQERWAVVGIGLNVAVRPEDFPPELRERATTLGLSQAEIEPTLDRLLGVLTRWLAAGSPEVLAAVRRRDALHGHRVRWAQGIGIADGIDEDGCLRVLTSDGATALAAGEVHLEPAPQTLG